MSRRTTIALALLALAACAAPRSAAPPAAPPPAAAVAAPPRPAGPDRSRPPGKGPPPELRVPEQRHFTLSNGLAVRLVEYRRLPIVALNLVADAGDVIGVDLRDTPHLPAPGLEIVFLSMRRTVSRLTDCMPGSLRAARSSSAMVQRWRPLGGAEQARAITRASALVSYWRGRPERSTSNTASSTPPCK